MNRVLRCGEIDASLDREPMPFRFDDRLIHQYCTDGYVVFRGIVPASLLRDLRREADKARAIAHQIPNTQAQRIQPVSKYAEQLNQKPFHDYAQLPELADAVTRLLGPNYTHGHVDIMGLLVEPATRPWTIGWHRDAVVEVPPDAYDDVLREQLSKVWFYRHNFHQVNCPIYAESCTWFVPGSHLRMHDLPGERQWTGDQAFHKQIASLSNEEAELACLDQCRNFPGAVQMHLEAGDYMIYRNVAWHNGNYVPYHPRATMHDAAIYHGPVEDLGVNWTKAKEEAVERLKHRNANSESFAVVGEFNKAAYRH